MISTEKLGRDKYFNWITFFYLPVLADGRYSVLNYPLHFADKMAIQIVSRKYMEIHEIIAENVYFGLFFGTSNDKLT